MQPDKMCGGLCKQLASHGLGFPDFEYAYNMFAMNERIMFLQE